MTGLKSLHIENNQFNGSIDGIQNLVNLNNFRADNNKLTGAISYLASLTSLTNFNVERNLLSGSVDSLKSLVNLESLLIAYNKIYSNICAFSNLTALTTLSATSNSGITGNVNCLTHLTNLTTLSLSLTAVTGSINSFSNLVKLETLGVTKLGLTGNMSSLYGLTKLTKLQMQNNEITGSLDGIEKLTALEVLSADFNKLKGTINPLASLQNLTNIQLTNNELTGDLSAITGLVKLDEISLSANKFTSTLPDLSRLESLVLLSIHSNEFTGDLTVFCDMSTKLKYLRVETNKFRGNLDCFSKSNYENLTVLYAGENLLEGNFNFMNSLQGQLQYLSLKDNAFTGQLPSSISRHTNLRFMDVSKNSLSGPMPSLQALKNLTSLFIQSNQFTGDALFGINKENHTLLQFVDLGNNRFSGEFPKEYFQLQNIQTLTAAINCMFAPLDTSVCEATSLQSLILDGLHLSSSCSGEPLNIYETIYAIRLDVISNIPSCIYTLPSLVTLHLSGNGIQHYSLPADIKPSSSLRNLLLSHNGITGELPRNFQRHQWEVLDISYNKFNGKLMTLNSSGNSSQEMIMAVNRLSGSIPTSARSISNINILDGNTFSCTTSELEHLQSDPSSDKYSCGSTSFDYSVGMAGILTAVVLLLVAFPYIVTYLKVQSYEWIEYIRTQCEAIKTEIDYAYVMKEDIAALYRSTRDVHVDSNRFKHLYSTGTLFENIRYYSLLTVGFYIVAYMPLYGALSVFYSTRSEEYTWTVSVAFLSGKTPATILAVIYMLLVTLLAFLSRKTILNSIKEFAALAAINARKSRHSRSLFTRSFRQMSQQLRLSISNNDEKCAIDSESTESGAAGIELAVIESPKEPSKPSIDEDVDEGELGDVFTDEVVTPPTSATRNTSMHRSFISATAVGATVIRDKLTASSAAIKGTLEEINHSGSIFLDEFSKNEAYKKDRRFLVLVVLAVLNAMVVVTFNAFFIYATLTFSYYGTIACQFFLAIFKIIWLNAFLLRLSSWLEKKYVYNSNTKILRSANNHHIRFYMGIVIFNSLILPCLVAAIVSSNCLFNAFKSAGSVSSEYTYKYCVVFDTNTGNCNTYVSASSTVTYTPPFYYTYECSFKTLTTYGSVYMYSLFLPSLIPFIHALVLVLYKNLRVKYPQYALQAAQIIKSTGLCSPIMMICSGDDFLHDAASKNKIFKQKLFLLTVMSKVCVLFTFGFVCPLIGIFAALSICMQLYYAQYQLALITKYYLAKKDLLSIETLSIQLDGLESAIIKCMWQLIPFAIVFYSVFLFDMSGDEIGAYSARGVVLFFIVFAIVIYFSPRLFYLLENVYQKYQERVRANKAAELIADDLFASYKTSSAADKEIFANPMHSADAESGMETKGDIGSSTDVSTSLPSINPLLNSDSFKGRSDLLLNKAKTTSSKPSKR